MIGPSKKKEPEKVEQPSGEVTEKTDKSRRAKFKKDFKARKEAEDKGYIDQSFWTGGIKSINREAMTRDLNNGELTRDMLVGMLDSGDLSKKRGKKGAVDETASDYEYVETALKLFPAPKPVKAEVIHGSTGDEPGGETTPTTAPVISKPPISDFKTDKISAALERSSGRSLATYRKEGSARGGKRMMELELMSASGKNTWNKMTPKEQKRFKLQGDKMGFTAAQSPDDKMNTMNDINTKNQTLQGQSGSPVIISNTTNANASTANSTSLIPMTTTVHAPKLKESNVVAR
jgi:hypothetical protein